MDYAAILFSIQVGYMFGWIVLLLLLCAVFVILHIFILPKYFLRYICDARLFEGRGLRRIVDARGVHIIYEPNAVARAYMPQYILSERNGKKYMICRIDNAIRAVDYDILLFNKSGKLFRILNVKENIKREGFTGEVKLPTKTSYAFVTVRAVDGIKTECANYHLSPIWLCFYIALCFIVETLGFFAIRECIGYCFGGLYGETYLSYTFYLLGGEVGISLLAVLLNLIIMFIVIKCSNRNNLKRGNANAGK